MKLPAEGGCTCGAVRYRVSGEPVFLTICHCSECQRQSGSAFGMSMRFKRSDVEIVKGELKRWQRIADNGNTVGLCFCGQCGTRILHEPSEAGFVHIKPGTLDDTSGLQPHYQSYTVRKHDWLELSGIDMSFERMPPLRDGKEQA